MKKSPDHRFLLCLVLVLMGVAFSTVPCRAQLTYKLAGGSETWPAAKRTAIINAMNQAVAIYNANGYFKMGLTANYNSGVPTAQASYGGWIDFGGSISTRVALHEFAHTQGTGTYWNWAPHNSGGVWTGAHATALVKIFDGASAVLNCDSMHYWPYGLNYDSEDSTLNRVRCVKMVSALCWDMGLVKDSDGDGLPDDWEMFHFGNLSQSDTDDTDQDGVNNLAEYNADTDPAKISTLTWKGGAGAWDTSTANWTGAATIWRNALCDQAGFGGTAGIVTAATGVQVNEIAFNTTGYQITGSALTLIGKTPDCITATGVSGTISAVLGGSGGLTKNGLGNLTLAGSGSNTYSGVTIVTSGTLALGKSAGVTAIPGNITIGDLTGSDVLLVTANEQIANASVISFNAGGAGNSAFLRINGGVTETVGGITTLSIEQAPVIEAGSSGIATLIVNNGSDCTYDGIIRNANGGTLALTKQGAGNLTLRNTAGVAAIAYTGVTTISGGTLTLSSRVSATGSQLVIDSFASPVTNNATLALDNDTGLSETLSPVISGNGSLEKTGAGTVVLDHANSYSGGTTLGVSNAQGTVGGILQISNGAALGTGSVSVYGGTPASDARGGQLQISGGITLNNPTLFVSGNGYGADNGILLNAGNDNTVNSPIRLMSGAGGAIIGSDAGTLTLGSGGISASVSGRTLEFTGAGNIQVNGVIANGSTTDLPLTKSGSGLLTLTAANTFTGGITISSGTLILFGNQTRANGGLVTNALNSATAAVNIGTTSQTVATSAAVASGNSVQLGAISGVNTATGASAQSLDVNGTSGFLTTVSNASPLAVGRNSALAIGSYATWNQSGSVNIQAYGGYGANLNVGNGSGSSGALNYTGTGAIQLSLTAGTTGNTVLNINPSFLWEGRNPHKT